MGIINQQFEFVFFSFMLATIVNIKEKFHYTAKMNNYLTQSEKNIYEVVFAGKSLEFWFKITV